MSPRQWLETIVDEEHAEELIKHRQRLRKPMTDFAAKLLAKKLALCSDPNAAAEMMIEKGWQSIEPDWFMKASGHRPSSNLDILEQDLAMRIENGTRSQGGSSPTPLPLFSRR